MAADQECKQTCQADRLSAIQICLETWTKLVERQTFKHKLSEKEMDLGLYIQQIILLNVDSGLHKWVLRGESE